MPLATCSIFSIMPPDELDKLMADLREWATQAEHGEQKKLAQLLGVKPQQVNHWITGRKLPNIGDGLRLQTFLKKWRRG